MMTFAEAKRILKSTGHKIIDEWRYNPYSDIGADPGYDEDQSGTYTGKVKWQNTQELKAISKEIFDDEGFLYQVVLDSDCPDRVRFEYNERRDEDSDFEWIDETDTWFSSYPDEDLLDLISDELDGTRDSDEHLGKAKTRIKEIKAALQKAVDDSIEYVIYDTREYCHSC